MHVHHDGGYIMYCVVYINPLFPLFSADIVTTCTDFSLKSCKIFLALFSRKLEDYVEYVE